MNEIIFWPKLSTRTRRAMVKRTKRFRGSYVYKPRVTLIERLQTQFGMSRTEVLTQLFAEMDYFRSLDNY